MYKMLFSLWRREWAFSAALCGFALISFEADLKYSISECVAVQWLDRHNRFIVVRHRDETEAFALIGLQVTDDFDALNGTEGPEQLPQHILLGLRRQVVHEYTPTRTVHRITRQHGVGQ